MCPCLNASRVGAEPAVDGVLSFGRQRVSQPMWSQVKYGLYEAGCDPPGPPSKCSQGPGDAHAKDKCHTRGKCRGVVKSLSRVPPCATPWTAARQASLSSTISQSLLRPMSIEPVMPSTHPILCRPLLLLPQSLPASGSFPVSRLLHRVASVGASASACHSRAVWSACHGHGVGTVSPFLGMVGKALFCGPLVL